MGDRKMKKVCKALFLDCNILMYYHCQFRPIPFFKGCIAKIIPL